MVSGEAGTGKTSVAAHLALAICQRGERCLYFAFEESEHEIIRNLRSIGIDLEPHVKSGLLKFYSSRATMYGLETHLVTMERDVNEIDPGVVILDPITNLKRICSSYIGDDYDIQVIDLLGHPELARQHQILAVPTVVRMYPPPERRVIGDLSRTELVVNGLELPVKTLEKL